MFYNSGLNIGTGKLLHNGYSCFPFYDDFNKQFTDAVFYIQNRIMCLSKKNLYQYFVAFFALLGTASPLETFYMSLHSTKLKNVREKATKCSLKTTKVLMDADGHVLT